MERLRILETVAEAAAGAGDASELRHVVLSELREHVGCDAAVFRPGPTWTGSRPVYLDAGRDVTEAYIDTPERYRAELLRWCERSRGHEAFLWEETYSNAERTRMATEHEILEPLGFASVMGCPLRFAGEVVGLVMLFRTRRARRFSVEAARDVTRLLPTFGVAEAAFRARPSSEHPALAHALETLGARERQVASLLAKGLTSKEIASALGTSFHTVRNQTRRVFERLGVRTRAELAARMRG